MDHNHTHVWQEEPAYADNYRQAYARGVDAFVSCLNLEAQSSRRIPMTAEVQDQKRKQYEKMLGFDLFSKGSSQPPHLVHAGENDLGIIYRLTVYVTDEIPFYALLILPHGVTEPMPLVIAQHGGGGTPELCSDLYGKNNYNHMVRRCLSRGAAVLAPQLLMWATKEIETQRAHPIAHDRAHTDAMLKRFGSSITALEISGIRRCLDYACSRSDIDSTRIGMMGLSYGGYFTLHTMAVEPRIKAGYSAGAFNSRDMHCLSDWSYPNAAFLLQDAEVAALCAPRKLYVQVGMADTVFDYHGAVKEAQQAKAYYQQLGAAENFQFDLWPGGHTVSDHDHGYDFLFSSLS